MVYTAKHGFSALELALVNGSLADALALAGKLAPALELAAVKREASTLSTVRPGSR